jgi:hypothetical protein
MISESKFLRLIERQKESGLSIKSFCSNEGIAPSTFYYRQKRIRKESAEKRFIPLIVKPTKRMSLPQAGSPEYTQSQQAGNAAFEIIYSNGTTLRVKNDMDLAGLRDLILLID